MENLRRLKDFIRVNRMANKKPYTFRQLSALIVIYEEDGLNMSVVANKAEIPIPQIKKNLDTLKDNGHIIIRQAALGGHEFECSITPKGKELLQKMCEVLA